MDISGHTCIALRYDFDESVERQPVPKVLAVVGVDNSWPCVMGIEEHNKYGEKIKRHLHFHFLYPSEDEKVVKKFVEASRKRLQRSELCNKRTRGWYSLTAPDVEDVERWFRYCLKQYDTLEQHEEHMRTEGMRRYKDIHPLPEGFDVSMQWRMANEEYKRDKEFLSSRRERQDKRQTTFEKIIGLIGDNKVVFQNEYEVFTYILDYYKSECLPVDRTRVRGMVDSVMLMFGLMTYQDYYRKVM